jgi:hypothetical protein
MCGMKMYRAYPINRADHVAAIPWILECEDDQGAMALARELAHNYPKIEIWDGSRRVDSLAADAASVIET